MAGTFSVRRASRPVQSLHEHFTIRSAYLLPLRIRAGTTRKRFMKIKGVKNSAKSTGPLLMAERGISTY
jgi:hypothetical protein